MTTGRHMLTTSEAWNLTNSLAPIHEGLIRVLHSGINNSSSLPFQKRSRQGALLLMVGRSESTTVLTGMMDAKDPLFTDRRLTELVPSILAVWDGSQMSIVDVRLAVIRRTGADSAGRETLRRWLDPQHPPSDTDLSLLRAHVGSTHSADPDDRPTAWTDPEPAPIDSTERRRRPRTPADGLYFG
jgi:hypothetical protein